MIDLKNVLSKIDRVAVINYIGCIFILFGNALPWPCLSYGARDCTVLQTYNLDQSWLGIGIVITLLLMPVGIRVFKPPLNYIFWFSFWIAIYVLFIPWLFPVYMDKEVWGNISILSTNQDLAGLPLKVFQLSLITFWLNIRPMNFQGIGKLVAYFCLVILALLTLFIYIPLEIRVTELVTDPSLYSNQAVFGIGPLSIILGCLLLLGTALYNKIPEKIILKKD
jgi:hypothetical protein